MNTKISTLGRHADVYVLRCKSVNPILRHRLYSPKFLDLKPLIPFLLVNVGIIFLTLLPGSLRAGHIVGGEFSYEFLGYTNNDTLNGELRYRVIINMYRDCVEEGVGAWFDGDQGSPEAQQFGGAEMNITVYQGAVTREPTRILQLQSHSDVPLNLGNPCLRTNAPICQQIGIYDFVVTVPRSDQTYTIVYTRCCRNQAITNIVNPSDVGITYFIQITPDAQERRSSSPKFNIDPPIAICLQEEFQIDLGATDKDGDSLAYKFCDPLLGAGMDCGRNGCQTNTPFDDIVPDIDAPPPYTPVTWRGPLFSFDDPFGTGSRLEIDTFTGLMSGNPAFPGTYTLAVCVEEWTRGPNPILLSNTKREMQLNVVQCQNTVEADLLETEIDDQGRFFIRACGLGEQTIINESTEERSITSYTWLIDGPDGPITGSSRDLTTPPINTIGVYPGTMILNLDGFSATCRDTADFLLGVYPTSYPEFEFTETGCSDDPIQFTDLSTTDADAIVSWEWDFRDGTDGASIADPRHYYAIPGDFPVQLTIVDNNQCVWDTVQNLPYFPTPRTIILEPDAAFGCVPYDKTFVNLSQPVDDTYLFEWELGDGTTSMDRSPSHTYEEAGIYDVYLQITSPTGCVVDSTFRRLVDVRDAPIADFRFEPENPSNLRPNITVRDQSTGAAVWRYYVRNQAGDIDFASPVDGFDYEVRSYDSVYVTQYVTHPSGCLDSITKTIALITENTFFAPDAFTPNGDGLNDIFIPVGSWDRISGYALRVWNRWGETVFTTNDQTEGWDGRFKEADAPGGGYLWDAQFTDAQGEVFRYKGGVVLLR